MRAATSNEFRPFLALVEVDIEAYDDGERYLNATLSTFLRVLLSFYRRPIMYPLEPHDGIVVFGEEKKKIHVNKKARGLAVNTKNNCISHMQ